MNIMVSNGLNRLHRKYVSFIYKLPIITTNLFIGYGIFTILYCMLESLLFCNIFLWEINMENDSWLLLWNMSVPINVPYYVFSLNPNYEAHGLKCSSAIIITMQRLKRRSLKNYLIFIKYCARNCFSMINAC